MRIALRHPEKQVVGHDAAIDLARAGYLQTVRQRNANLPLDKQNELMKIFHELPVWKNTWFHNVPIAKNPLDLWMVQQIFYEIQPEFVVETGTLHGGSALYWAAALEAMGLDNSKVITVDIENLNATASQHRLWKKYVTFMLGSSTDPALIKQIADRVRGHKTLVTLDSDHALNHVLNELHAYSGMVSNGSYLIVEDTHMDGVPTYPQFGPGPMAAVRKFLAEPAGRQFQQDFSREAHDHHLQPRRVVAA